MAAGGADAEGSESVTSKVAVPEADKVAEESVNDCAAAVENDRMNKQAAKIVEIYSLTWQRTEAPEFEFAGRALREEDGV